MDKTMSWVRIDDGFTEHPKVLSAGGDACWLHVCALSYCNRNLTDGFVPRAVLSRLSDRKRPQTLAKTLVEVALWELADGGWQIHDYLRYQPTRAETEAIRERTHQSKAEAGRLGGIASGVAKRKHMGEQNQSKPVADSEAKAKRNVAPTRPDPRESITRDDDDSVDTQSGQSSIETIIATTAKAIALKDRPEPSRGYIRGIANNLRAEQLPTVNACLAEHLSLYDSALRLGADPWFTKKALNGRRP